MQQRDDDDGERALLEHAGGGHSGLMTGSRQGW